jgi:hypothetical protein
MAATSTKKAGGTASGGSRQSSKKQSESSSTKTSSGSKKRASSKQGLSGVGASAKKVGRKTAKAVTGAVDTVAKATGLKSRKK